MRRPGNGTAYLERIARIRELNPAAAFRSNFIVGYPGKTEADHDGEELLGFVQEAQVNWCRFSAYSEEEGASAADLDDKVADEVVADRLGRAARGPGRHHHGPATSSSAPR